MTVEQEHFPEPAEPDERVMLRGETRWGFLHRSTWSRAAETRAFYNHALNMLPESSQKPLLRAIQAGETESSLLELLVGCLLQLRGATELQHEPESRGRRVDWRAVFADGTVHVEAFSPVYNAGSGKTAKRHERLLELLEDRVPDGWWLMPFHLPALPGDAPLWPFRKVADELLAQIPPADSAPQGASVHLSSRLPEGRVQFTAWRASGPGGLGGGAMISHYDNSVTVLGEAWRDRRKRLQGRSVPAPALLAIAGSFLGADLDDFESALFGRDLQPGHRPDGAMTKESDPPWAGVLALPRISPASAEQPVLFLAPAYAGPLPAAIERMEVRRLVDGEVVVQDAQDPDAWSGIRWAEP